MIVYNFDVWTLLGFLVQIALPLVIGVVSTKVTPENLKWTITAGITAVISLITSLLTAHDAHTSFDLFQAIITAVAGFLISVGTHFGVWTPTGIADKLLGLFRKDPAAPPAPTGGGK